MLVSSTEIVGNSQVFSDDDITEESAIVDMNESGVGDNFDVEDPNVVVVVDDDNDWKVGKRRETTTNRSD